MQNNLAHRRFRFAPYRWLSTKLLLWFILLTYLALFLPTVLKN